MSEHSMTKDLCATLFIPLLTLYLSSLQYGNTKSQGPIFCSFFKSRGTISLKHVILCSGKNFKCACPQGMLPMDNHAHECMWPEGEQVSNVELLLPK